MTFALFPYGTSAVRQLALDFYRWMDFAVRSPDILLSRPDERRIVGFRLRIGLATLTGGLLLAGAAAASRPNIVYIIADDLGYGDVQALNPVRGKIATPHLDRLAAAGMTFTDAHAGSSVCTPTRYGVLTGRYAWRTYLQRGVLDGFRPGLIADGRLTVPSMLRSLGYETAVIGKWHLGFTLEEGGSFEGQREGQAGPPVGSRAVGGPLSKGFDYFYGVQHARSMGTFFEQDRAVERVEPIDALGKLTVRATQYIKEKAHAGSPFFLYFALTSPHTPIVPSEAWQGRSGLGGYGDFVMETDWAVGEVLGAIKEMGLEDDTLVIFTSDNGFSPAADAAALEAQGHFPSAGLRGYKSDIWDGGHRVPFFARWPGRIEAGSVSDELICLTDLMATCAEILEVSLPPNAGEDSVSFWPALRGEERPSLREGIVHHSIEGRFSIRQGFWKLELCPGSGGWSAPRDPHARASGQPEIQLYELSGDPAETKNVQAEHPDVVARLRALLARYVEEGRSTPGPRQVNDSAIVIDPQVSASAPDVVPDT